jgi:hypothetical protein
MVAAAHASLAGYLKFKESPELQEWLEISFRKVVCKVSDMEFEQAKEWPDHLVLTESALGGDEVAIVFKPRKCWPRTIRRFKLYG